MSDKPKYPAPKYQALNAVLLGRIEQLVTEWLPGGKKEGKEYKCGSLSGGKGDSCSVNVSGQEGLGCWSDFATGEKGGDLLSLYAAIHGLGMTMAAVTLAREEGLEDVAGVTHAHGDAPVLPKPPRPEPPKPAPSKPEEKWEVMAPVPDFAPAFKFHHSHYDQSSIEHVAEYRIDAALYGYIVRVMRSQGGKLPLAEALSKMLDGAKNQAELDAIIRRVEALRKALGDKVADGLLDQAAQKATALKDALDKATPGINSVAEAMKKLGITSDASLKQTAATAKEAYDTMRTSGTASARELAAAFQKAATDAIAANGGIAPTWVAAQAAANGYELQVDSAGKATVRAAGEGAKGVDGLAAAYGRAGDAAVSAADRAVTALERQNAAQERLNAAIEKAVELERKRLNVDKEGFSTDKSGQRIAAGGDLTTLTGIAAFLKSAGVADDATARQLARQFSDGKGNIPYMNNPGQKKYGGDTISVALLKAAEQYTFGSGNQSPSQPATIPTPAKTYTVNVNLGGSTTAINTSSDADAKALIDLLQRAKLAA